MMNKKINSELIGINDIYFLKCLCTELQDNLNEYENMRKEAIKYVEDNSIYYATSEKVGNYFANCNCDDLLNILNKVGDNNEKN